MGSPSHSFWRRWALLARVRSAWVLRGVAAAILLAYAFYVASEFVAVMHGKAVGGPVGAARSA